eukprot:TRINITY_DN2636_c0_g1_i5.p2 TRINITY_DN2636_c0_g1~~TRINITY_DN2636_c0_g1_i5.p2  ORF type:complete len:101 (+),score=14.54 TRINITY_DN2636_c0_g1_i5:205-507(+)
MNEAERRMLFLYFTKHEGVSSVQRPHPSEKQLHASEPLTVIQNLSPIISADPRNADCVNGTDIATASAVGLIVHNIRAHTVAAQLIRRASLEAFPAVLLT